jgi:hypothetical protein
MSVEKQFSKHWNEQYIHVQLDLWLLTSKSRGVIQTLGCTKFDICQWNCCQDTEQTVYSGLRTVYFWLFGQINQQVLLFLSSIHIWYINTIKSKVLWYWEDIVLCLSLKRGRTIYKRKVRPFDLALTPNIQLYSSTDLVQFHAFVLFCFFGIFHIGTCKISSLTWTLCHSYFLKKLMHKFHGVCTQME